ncbi:MAG: hypothetical protein KTR31_29685 [Myxococcales bacterium]|nr:hypothetical protein [Myxococcales bacterium]
MRILWLLVSSLLFISLSASPARAANVTVAVLEFANTSGDAEWDALGKGFQEMFLVDLSKADTVQVVPRSDLRASAVSLGITVPAAVADRLRLAKQSGASFVMSGLYSVAGATMSLRVDLLDVTSGQVVLSDARDGEAEAFFDLQKQALTASMDALKLSLSPKERAEAGRLHTADFLAFQDFSRGLDYFDAERYEAGLRSLRSATERDAAFSLAAITLAQYQERISQIRTKAESIGVVRAEQERMKRLAMAGDAVDATRRLLAVAADGSAGNQRERLTALYLLTLAYQGKWFRSATLRNYYAVQDRFAMRRASEQLAARYHAEALPLWPALPVKIDEDFVRDFPSGEDFDADFAEAVTYLWERGVDSANNRKSYLLDNLRYPREMAKLLRLSLADEIALFDRNRELALAFDAEPWRLKNEQEEMVKEFRRVLRFDDSTRILDGFAEVSENQYALKGFANEIERNRDFVALLSEAKDRSQMEEWLLLAIEEFGTGGNVRNMGREHFGGKGLDPEGAALLTRVRDWPRDSYLLVDDVPVWVHQPGFFFHPGPMSDPRRAESFRYNRASSDDLDGLVFMGAEPLGDLDLGFTLTFTAPDDFWPGSAERRKLQEGRPDVAALVGLVDLDVPLERDPVTREDSLGKPLRGIAVWLRDGELQLVQTTESERGSYDRKAAFTERVLAKKSLPRLSDRVRVDVAVRGTTLVATVGNRSVKTKLSEAPVGYQGFQLRGQGFVEISDLFVTGRAGSER